MTDFNLLARANQSSGLSSRAWLILMGAGLIVTCLLFVAHTWLVEQEVYLRARLASINENLAHIAHPSSSVNNAVAGYQAVAGLANNIFSGLARFNHFSTCLTAVQISKEEVRLFGNTSSTDQLTEVLHQLPYLFSIHQLRAEPGGGLIFDVRATLPHVDLLEQKKRYAK